MEKEAAEKYLEACKRLRKAFVMTGLAVASNKPREWLERMPKGYRAEPLAKQAVDQMRERVVSGAVTTIVADPEPFTVLIYLGDDYVNARCIYGVWVGRRASFFGNAPKELPRLGMLTPEQAIAKGIPMPKEESADGNS